MNKNKNLKKLHKEFLSKYPIERIMSLTFEEYAIGCEDSFCYWVERKLDQLGRILGANSSKFGVWYGKHGNDRTVKPRCTKNFSKNEDVDEALDNVNNDILIIGGYKHEN